MIHVSYIKSRGVALIQVLLISTIISLLAIQFSYTARDHVSQAMMIEQRTQAELLAYSTLQQSIFSTLVSERYFWTETNEDQILLKNAMPFSQEVQLVNGVTVSMQDIGAMLPLQYMSHPFWLPYLLESGMSEGQAQEFIGTLTDIQDSDTNLYIPGQTEPVTSIMNVPYLNRPIQNRYLAQRFLSQWPNLQKQLDLDYHLYPIPTVSIMQTSNNILNALLPSDMVNEIIQRRNERSLLPTQMRSILGSKANGEHLSFSPSVFRRIRVEVTNNDIMWHEEYDIRLQSLSTPPYLMLGRRFVN